MTPEEARAWLEGQRSMTNIIPQDPFESWSVRVEQADAAKFAQAYYVLKAHAEGLLGEGGGE